MREIKKQFNSLYRSSAPSKRFKQCLRYKLEAELISQGDTPVVFYKFVLVPVAVICLFVATGTGAFAYASPAIVIDHPLYQVKQGIEGLEERFATTPERKARYYLKMANRRLSEGEEYLVRQELPPALVAEIDAHLERSLREAVGVKSRPEIVDRLSVQQNRYERFLELAQNKQLIPVVITKTSQDGLTQSYEAAFLVMDLARVNQVKPMDQEVMTWDVTLLPASQVVAKRNKQDFMRVWIDESNLTSEVKQSLLELVDREAIPVR